MKDSIFDLNAAYPAIASRLKSIEGVRAVKGVNDLAQVLNGNTTGTDSYVYLMYEEDYPTEKTADNHRYQVITVVYQILIASQTYGRDGIPENIGKLKARIMRALTGFCPFGDDSRDRRRLRQIKAGKSVYGYGYSLHPLKFEIDLIITGE